jgi:hypothetical protein
MNNEQLTQNEVNKLVYFPAKYLHRVKKIFRNQLKNILCSSFAEEIRIQPCVLTVCAVLFQLHAEVNKFRITVWWRSSRCISIYSRESNWALFIMLQKFLFLAKNWKNVSCLWKFYLTTEPWMNSVESEWPRKLGAEIVWWRSQPVSQILTKNFVQQKGSSVGLKLSFTL